MALPQRLEVGEDSLDITGNVHFHKILGPVVYLNSNVSVFLKRQFSIARVGLVISGYLIVS